MTAHGWEQIATGNTKELGRHHHLVSQPPHAGPGRPGPVLMAFRPERAREVLPQVDPARLRWGWPVGLRDGALLALIAAGLTPEELAELKARVRTTMTRTIERYRNVR